MDAELKVLHQSIEEDGLRDAGLSQRADELSMMDRARQEANEKSRQGTLTVVNSGPPVNMGGRGLELRNRKGTDAIREVAERYAHVPAERKGAVLRDKAINSLLAVFLGTFGAHKFFQGKTYSGILYAVFFWTFLPTFIGFVEGIRYAVMPLDDYYKQYFRD
jgi:TM2 domain-containing membrane protein YozV